MNVKIKLFAAAKELMGGDELVVDVPAGSTVADLRQIVAGQQPALGKLLPHSLWAVDAEYAANDTPLTEHSHIALIPPVSGG
jgi:sulfur-carrier protein